MIFLRRRVLPVLLVSFLLFSYFSPAYSIAIADDMVFVLAFLSLIGMSSAYLAGHAGDSAYWETMAESIVQSIDDARSDLLTAGNVIWGDENGDGNADADDLPTGAAVKALLSSPGQVAVGKNIMLVSYPAMRFLVNSIADFKDKVISFADESLQTIVDYYFPPSKLSVNSFHSPVLLPELSTSRNHFYWGNFQGWDYPQDNFDVPTIWNEIVGNEWGLAYIYWTYAGRDYFYFIRKYNENLDASDYVFTLLNDPYKPYELFDCTNYYCHYILYRSDYSDSQIVGSATGRKGVFMDSFHDSLGKYFDETTVFSVYLNPALGAGLSADDVGVGYFPDSVTDTQYKVPAIDKPLSIPTVGALEGVLSNPAFSKEDALELAGTINPNIGLEGEGGGEVVVPPADDDFSPWLLPDFLKERFPFSVPFDLIAAFRTLASAERNAPHFEYRLYSAKFGIDYTFVVDLSDFDSAAQIFRTMELLLFVVGLILISRNMIRG